MIIILYIIIVLIILYFHRKFYKKHELEKSLKNMDNFVIRVNQMKYPDKERATRLYLRWFRLRESNSIFVLNDNHKKVAFLTDKDKKLSIKNISNINHILVHEAAHMMSKSFGHNEEFYKNYNLLKKIY